MPTLDEIVDKRLRRLDSIPEDFITSAQRAQRQAMRRLTELIGAMDTVDGKLILNEANVARISEVTNRLINEDLMGGEYGRALRDYLQEFGIQGDINDEMFQKIVGSLTVDPNWKLTIKQAQANTLRALGANGIDQALGDPIRRQLLAAVTEGMDFEDAVDALRVFMEGNSEVLGRLNRHASQIAYDAFAFTDRNYSHTVATSLGFEWYRYQGVLVRDSRQFCQQRVGQIFHRTEIESWAALQWGGKAQGTTPGTIWDYAGGYNCGHSFVPVIQSEVPDTVRSRVS